MKSVALVTLDTISGKVRRYLRAEGNKPEKTGEAHFENWAPESTETDWGLVWKWLQVFRIGYVPPDPTSPRPTGPKMAEAA